MPLDGTWDELHLFCVLWLSPTTITAVEDGGNHFTTTEVDNLDPLVKAYLKLQFECPFLLRTTPATRWVAIEIRILIYTMPNFNRNFTIITNYENNVTTYERNDFIWHSCCVCDLGDFFFKRSCKCIISFFI